MKSHLQDHLLADTSKLEDISHFNASFRKYLTFISKINVKGRLECRKSSIGSS